MGPLSTGKRSPSEGEFTFEQQCIADKLPAFQREYRFDPHRRWRFDFAFVPQRLGIEIEGGLWTLGAHSRPKGILRDMEKANSATLLGWAVLRYSTKQVRDGIAVAEVKRFLKERFK